MSLSLSVSVLSLSVCLCLLSCLVVVVDTRCWKYVIATIMSVAFGKAYITAYSQSSHKSLWRNYGGTCRGLRTCTLVMVLILPWMAEGSVDDYCSNGPNSYFCASNCSSYYYCNGQKKGSVLQCPTGTVCKKLGPHRKHFDSDQENHEPPNGRMYDKWDVTYACETEATTTASCWKQRTPGLCEVKGGLDQTCSGGGRCRSTSPDCAAHPLSRSCKSDSVAPENCECFNSTTTPPTSFDPMYMTNMTSIVGSHWARKPGGRRSSKKSQHVKVLERCWKGVGKVLERCWEGVGKVLGRCRKVLGRC